MRGIAVSLLVVLLLVGGALRLRNLTVKAIGGEEAFFSVLPAAILRLPKQNLGNFLRYSSATPVFLFPSFLGFHYRTLASGKANGRIRRRL